MEKDTKTPNQYKRRAEEAEAGRREIERLYDEFRAASERARQAEVFEQMEKDRPQHHSKVVSYEDEDDDQYT